MTAGAALAAFRRHLLAGAYGDRELLMPADRDYSGMWSALCDELVVMEARFGWDNPVVQHLRTRMNQVADAPPNAVEIFALCTTEYGRRAA